MTDVDINQSAAMLVSADHKPWHMPRLPHINIPCFSLHTYSSPGRNSVEDYIRARFAEVHHAEIHHFLPKIISLDCGTHHSAAVGLAPAESGPLFLEQYLKAPVEQLISDALNTDVSRNQIVEIGNLVSTYKGSSLLLFIVIGEVLERLGFRYVVFTGTREVKMLLARLHYFPTVITDAIPSALPDSGASWGSYYNHQPQVMFGDNQPPLEIARKNRLYRATVKTIDGAIERICADFRQTNAASSGAKA